MRTKQWCFILSIFLTAWAGPLCAAETEVPTEVSIEDSINATLRNHKSLKVIQENREVIVHELDRAKAGWGPRLDATARAGVGLLSNSTTRGYGANKDMYGANGVSLTLVQPLWDGYATRSRVRAAEATLDSMDDRVFDNATTLGLDSIIAHIDLNRRREIWRLATQNVARHEEILASSRDRELMGTDTMADVSQTEGRLARALSTLAEAEASLSEAVDSYARLTGMPAPEMLGPVPMPTPLFTGPQNIFEVALLHNPKLNAYASDIVAAAGEKDLAKSAYHPIINLEAGPNYSDRSGPGDQWTYSFDVMGTMRWNLFNSGADVASVKAACARVRQSREFLYDFVDTMLLDIQNTWTAYNSSSQQFQHYTEAIGYNTRTRDSYLDQFLIGQRSLLDVLDSESELFNSSTQAVTAQGNILVAAYRMYALAGDLLPHLGISTEQLYKAPLSTRPEDSPYKFNQE